ncbi:MAG: restriction endonuclease subunit S [Dehalococcoidia bacterium]
MAPDATQLALGDLTENFDAMRLPVKQSQRRSGPYPYYGASGIVDHVDRYIFDGEYLLIAEDGENLRTRNTPIAFLARGKFWVNNHAHIVRGTDAADTRYLLYALLATDIRGYLTGSTMPKLTQANLNRLPIPAPPLAEQRAIAHILGTLDDKIELNRRMAETLEAIARAIFKSWFVDFDPVRAKAEGRDTGLPKEIADLFPDRLVESEIGEVPRTWLSAQFSEIAFPRRERLGERRGVVLSAIASGHLVPSESHFTKKVYSKDTSKYLAVHPGDFAYNPSRINIGSIGMSLQPGLGAVSPVYVVFQPRPAYGWLIDFLLRTPSVREWITTLASGSVRQSLSWSDFASIPVVVPPQPLVEVFNALWSSLRHGIEARALQGATLCALRDTLLPKLISGELRVPEAMLRVEEATA